MNLIKQRQLGETTLNVSELGLGGASFGNLYREISQDECQGIIQYYLAQGINLIDTAPYYGFGLSEKRLGAALLKLDKQSQAIISSKVGRVLEKIDSYQYQGSRDCFFSDEPFSPVFDYSYDGVMRSFESSLKRLKKDKIELLLIHDIGKSTHQDKNPFYLTQLKNGGYLALNELKNNGDISAIGIGVNEVDACLDAMQWGSFDCFLLAGRYSLLEQQSLIDFFPACQQYGASVIAGGIYNSGILATNIFDKNPANIHYNYQPASADIINQVKSLALVCHEYQVNLPSAALQFVLANPVVSSVIPGISSITEAQQTIGFYHEHIPNEFWLKLKEQGLIAENSPIPQFDKSSQNSEAHHA